MLIDAGIEALVCSDFDELMRRVEEPIGAVLLTEDTLTEPHVIRLSRLLGGQPPWSDLPILVFAATRIRANTAERLTSLGNVTFVDRPVQRRTMIAAVRAALRSRRRQYEGRSAIEARDQFLAMLGHELRNPLSVILLATQLVNRRGTPDEHTGKQVGLIERQVRNLGRLVDDLLDVSRVTSGKVVLKREPVDIVALVERCVHALDPLARAHGLRVTFDAPAARPSVDGDAVRLEQVTTNLLANAIKYTPRDGRIRVAVEQQADGVVIRVRDTGVGIAADQLQKIFDVFVQAATALDRSSGGLGLGLSVVRGLVEMHGGTVSAASAGPGLGSEFVVQLPVMAAAATSPAPAAPQPRPGEVRRKVVVVEDNGDIREMLQEVLTASGHDVVTACDGPGGLSRLLAARPDVALVDIGLPGFDGYHLARAVRDQAGAGIFLVAMTGYGQPEDRARAIAAGFDEHLTKPVDLQRLEQVLEEAHPPS
jgi:signal transduction histidine kinase